MSGPLDDTELGIRCPKCGHETKKRIGWIKLNREFTCKCGERVTFDPAQFSREFRKIENTYRAKERKLGDAMRRTKNLGK